MQVAVNPESNAKAVHLSVKDQPVPGFAWNKGSDQLPDERLGDWHDAIIAAINSGAAAIELASQSDSPVVTFKVIFPTEGDHLAEVQQILAASFGERIEFVDVLTGIHRA